MSDDPRAIRGASALAMYAAPNEAYYIWCNSALAYPRTLARMINRVDLQVVGPNSLDHRDFWASRPITGIVVDHALEPALDDNQREVLAWARARVASP